MNKRDVVAEVAIRSGVTKSDTEKVLDTFYDVIINKCKEGERITLQGFGVFHEKEIKGGIRRNPFTNSTFESPAKRVMKFRASYTLREVVETEAQVKKTPNKAAAKPKGVAEKKPVQRKAAKSA